MKDISVADIMTRKLNSVKPDTTILNCAKMMVKTRAGSLLLVEKKRLVGIIARKDILWALVKKPNNLTDIKAIDISPRKIATIKPNQSIDYALKKMKKFKFERLPVIHKKELVGVITIKDIFNFNPEIYPEIKENIMIKEEQEKLKRLKRAKRNSFREGICEGCGNVGLLSNFNGTIICDLCKDSK